MTTTPWAIVDVTIEADRSTRESFARDRDLGDELGAMLADHPSVGGVEHLPVAAERGPTLRVYTDPGGVSAVERRATELAAAFGLRIAVHAEVRTDDDWRDTWKQFYRPIVVGDGELLLRPSWIAREPDHPSREIVLDPGRAFGTGLHETTRLCLDAIVARARTSAAPRAVLDLGCGSGILALAAARMFPGARVVAIDDDPEATATTVENAADNDLADRLTVVTGDLDHADADRVRPASGYDLVLANIRAETLIPRARALAQRVEPGAKVVLSGVLADELDAVERAYLEVGFARDGDDWPRRIGEWVALDLKRGDP